MEGYQNKPGESFNFQSVYPEPEDVPLTVWQPNQPDHPDHQPDYQQLETLAAYGDQPGEEEEDSSDDMSVDDYDEYNDPRADDSDEDSSYELPEDESTSGDEIDDVEGENEEGEIWGRPRKKPLFGARGGKGVKRGPRRPMEPSPEFKLLHSEATSAFIDGDYDKATDLVKQAIHINPEMFAAHSLLSEIFLSQGEKDKAVTALFSAAHTRPRDPSVWIKVAKLILERTGVSDRQSSLQDVLYCYRRAIDIDPKNYNIRFHRASIYRELGHNGKAAQEFEKLLNEQPHDMDVLRQLSETYIDLNEVERAKTRYEKSITYFTSLSLEESTEFTWSDVNIYTELFSYLDQYEEGLVALKSLARWLLGRKKDELWDSIQQDDREWDAEDDPRRLQTPGFEPEVYPLESYGFGLPLELRVKLGIYRLKMGPQHKDEALYHLDWLEPEDTSPSAKVFDFGDLFREAADALKEAKLYESALRFYVPLQQIQEHADISLFMAMGDCFIECGETEEAENCYLTVSDNDEQDMEVRVKLVRLYENIGMAEQAYKYVNEAVLLGRRESSTRKRRETRAGRLARELRLARADGRDPDWRAASTAPSSSPPLEESDEPGQATETPPMTSLTFPASTPGARRRKQTKEPEEERGDSIQYLYSELVKLQPKMREGDEESTEDWLDIADALVRDFRSNRVFFPMQRHMTFLGYSREAQKKTGQLKTTTFLDELQDMAKRLQAALGREEPEDPEIPNDYHNISFDEWLDVFLEYALVLSGQGESDETYRTLAAAADASIWFHSKETMTQIQTCWFTCALRLNDEETLYNIARWFMREYQFVTDASRLFALLSRLNTGDPRRSLFHSTASMKFMLRQIKAIDYTLPHSPSRPSPVSRTRPSVYHERASLSTKDEEGNFIGAEDMDVSLLVLYGHILYAGTSFTNALNYFFRAYALDPENAAVLLSIGISYIHHSLKRQSDNRHYLIMQGLSFMEEYRRVRQRGDGSVLLQEKQEMEFNFARVWHMLGIAHLAVRGYERCLEISEEIQKKEEGGENGKVEKRWVEDFGKEAAFALQTLYGISGDVVLAKRITERWLVI